MLKVVGIRFKKAGKIYYFDPVDTGVEVGDHVIVETVRGLEYGTVVIGARDVEENKLVSQLKPVMRKATEQDALKVQENKVREKEAFNICLRKIAKHGLPMRLIDVEFTFDVNKIIFYFTADGRIDFRELVKDLASVFRTRIELRQIGVRDEAKMLGGIGSCGRPLCCATFLGDFEPVSIRMAKDQNLSLNPAKISGVCGRLMCCLKYENVRRRSAWKHRRLALWLLRRSAKAALWALTVLCVLLPYSLRRTIPFRWNGTKSWMRPRRIKFNGTQRNQARFPAGLRVCCLAGCRASQGSCA